jgi:hypothetical protein
MGKRQLPRAVATDAVPDHAATLAWRALAGNAFGVGSVERLKESKKTHVYRLELVGGEPATVIAKWKPRHTPLEMDIYRRWMPAIGLPSLHVYGDVDIADGWWVFLEDVGDQPLTAQDPNGRRLVSQWLAELHQWGGFTTMASDIPKRRDAWYLEAVRACRDVIHRNFAQPWVTAAGQPILNRLLLLLDHVEDQWPVTAELLRDAPQSLTHGDLAAKNIRLRSSGGVEELVVLDWETAAVASPSVDLGSAPADLAHYAVLMRRTCPDMTSAYVEMLAAIGQLFRAIAALRWRITDLEEPWYAIDTFVAFEALLAAAIERLPRERYERANFQRLE